MVAQDYELKIIVKVEGDKDPADWLFSAVREGKFKENCLTTYLTEVTPIDRENPEYKWIKDIDNLE